MYQLAALIVFVLAGCASGDPPALDPAARAERGAAIRLAGASIVTPLVRHLARSFEALHPGTAIAVEEPLDAAGALMALADEVLDGALWVGGPDEVPPDGAVVLATSPIVLAAGPGVPLRSITIDELAATLRGELQTWANGRPRTFLLRPLAEPAQRRLAQLAPALDAALADAVFRHRWAIHYSDAAYQDALRQVQGSLAVAALGSLRLLGLPTWKVAVVDATGRELGDLGQVALCLVVPKEPRPRFRAFVDFVTGDEGRALLDDLGYDP